MALLPLHGAREPLGQFDLVDGYTILGGEVAYLAPVTWNSTDLSAPDVTNDGYTGTTSKKRPAVALVAAADQHPLFLTDDGSTNADGTGYGTLFGQVVGGTVGQQVTSGAKLGPATYLGSGKCTLWRGPGLYGVTLDAVDSDATSGLAAANANCTVGAALSYTSAGLLTLASGSNKVSSGPTVGYFEEFMTNGSLVNTPPDLVGATNSPSGPVASVNKKKMTMAVVWFLGNG